MKGFKKIFSSFLISSLIVGTISSFSFAAGFTDYMNYKVLSGDTLWKLSIRYSVSIQDIKSFNNLSTDGLYIGQSINIPVVNISSVPRPAEIVHTVQTGESLWKISQTYGITMNSIMQRNNMTQTTLLYINQKLIIPLAATAPAPQPAPQPTPQPVSTEPYVTNEPYYVQSGDTVWSIAEKFGIPMTELLRANNMTESSMLSINQKIIIPVHHVPVTVTKGSQYGEYLDWWTQAQYVFPMGKTAKVTDFYTGKSWYVKRTIGANHSDTETLTSADTAIMKEVFGGSWTWNSRPVIVEVDGRRIAAALAGMPHAGVDSAPAGANVDNRSGNYGYGPNFDYIKGNNMDGHFDIHFLNSTTHNTGEISASMQANIKIAAGVN